MPRYEYTGGSSNKFWEITVEGNSFSTTYGRIGTDGQTTFKEYDSEEKAQKEADKLTAKKVKKGYVLVGGGKKATAATKATAAKKKTPKPKKTAATSDPTTDVMRYELSDGKSNKFWEIKLEGKSFSTTYGKIGTGGQTSLKEYASEEKAQKEYDKIVGQKIKKGYVLVARGAAPAAKKKTAAKAEAPSGGSSSVSGGPRYELVDGKSSKFWEIKLEGKSFSTTYGRIGTDGKTTVKELGSASAARKERDKLVAQKTKKGYVLVDGGAGAGGPAAATAQNPKLEAAILKNPDDTDAYLVYADWLQTQGDPRGELITIQHGLVADPKNTKLRKAEAKLLADHGEHFVPTMLGEMLAKPKPKKKDWQFYKLDSGFCHAEWHCGFLKSVVLGREGEDDPHSLEDLIDELFAHPSARFLQELRIGALGIYDEYDYGSVVTALVNAKPASLRSFRIADFMMEDSELSWSHLGKLDKLIKAMPNLEHLAFRGGSWTLGPLDLPKLKSFRVETGGLSAASVKSIVSAKWPKLESLHIYFGDDNYGAGGNLKMITPILEGQGLKKLKHLGLMNADFTNEICKALPTSKILKQLETLDLSLGTMSDEGAQLIADNAKKFSHLRRLNVDDNYLTKTGEKALKEAKLEINYGGQRETYDDEDEDRYVSVGE